MIKLCSMLAWSISFPVLADLSLAAGYSFGGEVQDPKVEQSYSVRSAPSYMATLDFATGTGENLARRSYHNYLGVLLSWQGTEIDHRPSVDVALLYAHLTASRRWHYQNFATFVSGGAGVTHFEVHSGNNIQRFSVSLGGGYFYHLTEYLDVKLEGRLYSSFVNQQTKIECGSGCQWSFSGNYWSQLGLNLGFNYRF